MSDFFSKISGQFSGALLMSAFFPVLLFMTALTLVVLPITPYGHDFTAAVQDPKVWETHPFVALVLTFVVLVLSVMLYNMNIQIVRLYEGYPWKDAWIAKLLMGYRRRHFGQAKLLRQRIKTLRLHARLTDSVGAVGAVAESQKKLAELINIRYPIRDEAVLPTRLGNVIRSFEMYPKRQYGMAAIVLWPRLQPLIEGNLAQSLDSVKTSFDFMIHSAFLSGLLAVLTAASGLYWKTRAMSDLWHWWLVWTIAFCIISYLFYLASIARALEWGSQVKTAFDLYRLTLLKKLGYDLEVANLTDERRIWEIVKNRLIYPDEDIYPDLPYKLPSSSLIVDPATTIVKFARTVKPLEDGSLMITLVVSNFDPAAWNADRVIVREELPSAKVYVRDSANVDGVPATLLSITPFSIDLGSLAYGNSRTVLYRISGSST